MAGNIKLTSAGSSGTTTLQSTETTDRVLSLPDSTDTLVGKTTTDALTNKTVTFAAGTTLVAPVTFASGTNLTSAAAGAMEYDGLCHYSTHVASARGVNLSAQYSIVAAGGFGLSTAAGVQACFATTGDVWTLNAATTYRFEGIYWIQKATNSVSVAMAFATGGSITSMLYTVWGQNTAADTTGTTPQMTNVDTNASTIVAAASTTNVWLTFRGLLRMNAGGTLTPQINFSGTAAGTPTMLANSYIMFEPLGTNTNNTVGNVG